MIKIFYKIILLTLSFSIFCVTEININEGTMSPIVMSLPDFDIESKDTQDTYDLKTVSSTVKHVITKDLLSSGMFKINQYTANMNAKNIIENAEIDMQKLRNTNTRILTACQLFLKKNNYECIIKIIHDTGHKPEIIKLKFTLKSNDIRLLGHHIANAIYQIAWSIPGDFDSQLVYIAKHKYDSVLVISDRDGENPQTILIDKIILTPAVSRDGRFIAYAKYIKHFPYLFVYDRKTNKHTQLTFNEKISCAPVFLHDNEHIVYSVSENGQTSLYKLNIFNPKNAIQVTNSQGWIDTTPAYTANPNTILMISDRNKTPKPFVFSLFSGEVKQILTAPGSYYEPTCCINPFNNELTQVCLSKRYKGIAYLSMLTLDKNFNVMQERDLWQGPRVQGPSWSINGSTIFFNCLGLRMINIFTGSTKQLPILNQMNISCESPVCIARPSYEQNIIVQIIK